MSVAPGAVNRVEDVRRGLGIRVDHQIGAHGLPELVGIAAPEALGFDPDHRSFHPGLFREQAGDEVHLVVGGHCNQEVGMFDAGLAEDVRVGARALDGQNIELLLDFAEPARVFLDHRNVVAATSEQLSDVGADLAGTDHDYMHRPLLPLRRPNGTTIGPKPWGVLSGRGTFPLGFSCAADAAGLLQLGSAKPPSLIRGLRQEALPPETPANEQPQLV